MAAVLVVVFAVAVPWAVAGVVRSNARTAVRRSKTCNATIRVADHVKYVINRYVQDAMRFVPGTVAVKSGCTLTFEFATRNQSDAHSLSIVEPSDLPKTAAQMENCKVCGQIAARHLAHPGRPPGPTNRIAHWIVNARRPGFDVPGDSIAIAEAKGVPPGHQRVTVTVSAPAGATLRFICGLHAWMQGKIVVT